MLVGSCHVSCVDNWSVQVLDDSLMRIARVSSCLRTLVWITNCPNPRVLVLGNSVQLIRVVSCRVHLTMQTAVSSARHPGHWCGYWLGTLVQTTGMPSCLS